MMVEVLREGGRVAFDRNRLKIFVKTPLSWSANFMSTLPDG